MKVRDYVRYEYEDCIYIGKIKFISEVMGFDETLQFEIDNCNEEILKQDIIKSSPNIIDLIEVGDYVNGYYVTTGNQGVGSIYIAEIDGLGLKKKLYEKDITSIVTKEQFEKMEYKINKE